MIETTMLQNSQLKTAEVPVRALKVMYKIKQLSKLHINMRIEATVDCITKLTINSMSR